MSTRKNKQTENWNKEQNPSLKEKSLGLEPI